MKSLTAMARRLNFIRETDGPNRGAWVNGLQRYCHGQSGDSWCADFVSFVLDWAYFGKSPLRLTGSTQQMLDEARTKGFVVDQPDVDDLFFFLNANGLPHHVGIVTGVGPLFGIAGNTSEDGLSVNGTGVFEHAITVTPSRIVFVRTPR
jgi:hypothetical protein